MKIPLGVAVAMGLVLSLVAPVHTSAWAAWHVSSVEYTYGWDAGADQDVFDGLARVGHIWRSGGQGWYYACAEAYGTGEHHTSYVSTDPHDAQGRPLLGHSNLNARLVLGGAPPPQRPPTWRQKSYLNGHHCIHFLEVEGPAGLCSASRLSMTGLMGYNPPTQGHTFQKGWEPPDGVQRWYGDDAYLEDPNWVWRTTDNQYRAAWVYAGGSATVYGQGGIVRCEVKTCAQSWGILHDP